MSWCYYMPSFAQRRGSNGPRARPARKKAKREGFLLNIEAYSRYRKDRPSDRVHRLRDKKRGHALIFDDINAIRLGGRWGGGRWGKTALKRQKPARHLFTILSWRLGGKGRGKPVKRVCRKR